jgi:hypothetical protein
VVLSGSAMLVQVIVIQNLESTDQTKYTMLNRLHVIILNLSVTCYAVIQVDSEIVFSETYMSA